MKKGYLMLVTLLFVVICTDQGIALAQNQSHYKYRGAETCAAVCHNGEKLGFQYDIWKNSAHAKSFDALATKKAGRFAGKAGVDTDPRESLKCLMCHTTGAGLDTSYYLTTYRIEDGVTCEACHKEKSMTKTIIPHQDACLNCHNKSVHKQKKFVYEERFPLIVHPMPKEKPAK